MRLILTVWQLEILKPINDWGVYMKDIAAIVVTYNRVTLLKNCLDALSAQTYPLKKIFVVDNASSDSTKEFLEAFRSKMPLEVICLETNQGGAGGFYEGLSVAHKKGAFYGFWLMDDDGVPAETCLEELLKYSEDYPYVCPLVLDIEDDTRLAFPRNGTHDLDSFMSVHKGQKVIENMSAPFNGILLRKDMVDKVGYPKKEMFIWGDEVEYNLRSAYFGFIPVTVVKAIHRHPVDRLIRKDCILKKGIIIDVDSPLRNYCKYRNTAYALKKYRGWLKVLGLYIVYMTYFLLQDRWNWKKFQFFHKAFMDGIKEDFSKHVKYIGK